MTKVRQHPRINLRFDSLLVMDEIEALAHHEGLDLQNWLRCLSYREVRYATKKPPLIQELLETMVFIRLVTETQVDPQT